MPRTPPGWDAADPFAPGPWRAVRPLPPFRLAATGAPARQPTTARLAWDDLALYVRFDCTDRDAWSTFTRRDDPLYREEAVELFLAAAPGAAAPTVYYEFNVSPAGVLFDARIDNPHGDRRGLVTEPAWDAPGLRWAAGRTGNSDDWWAALALPWAALAPATPAPQTAPLPRRWRANLYRIDRPRDGSPPEFSAWSPTFVAPPDFHRPARFGVLELGEG